MKVFRKADASSTGRAGYSASYVADINFANASDTSGIIFVAIPKGTRTSPHAHALLQEVFIAMNRTKMGISSKILILEPGDVVLTDPGEFHWFETYEDEGATVIAIKVPNLKDDKIASE